MKWEGDSPPPLEKGKEMTGETKDKTMIREALVALVKSGLDLSGDRKGWINALKRGGVSPGRVIDFVEAMIKEGYLVLIPDTKVTYKLDSVMTKVIRFLY